MSRTRARRPGTRCCRWRSTPAPRGSRGTRGTSPRRPCCGAFFSTPAPGDVHVRAAVALVREDRRRSSPPPPSRRASSTSAGARSSRCSRPRPGTRPRPRAFSWSVSPPFGVARDVRDHALGPLLGLLGAVVGDHRAHEREVVHVRARADADLALELRVGEVLVVLAGPRDSPRPWRRRSAARAPRTRTRGRRDGAAPRGCARRAPSTSPAGRGPVCSARHRRPASTVTSTSAGLRAPSLLQALEQRVLARLDAVDLDAGLLGEVRRRAPRRSGSGATSRG